uniref:ShKT domain-containing protein n=1 Tax=Rhabditophanes sp. KR3021 TaxID=114890 RepID=A0AC35U3S1_9BILA
MQFSTLLTVSIVIISCFLFETEGCADLIGGTTPNSCYGMRTYCTKKEYLTLMKEKCQKTCGYCGTTTTTVASTTCIDMAASLRTLNCLNTSLCGNATYKVAMKNECKRSCFLAGFAGFC